MSVAEQLTQVRRDVEELSNRTGQDVVLVAVSKTKPDEDVMAAYEAGQRDFGENRVQELVGKAQRLPKDIRWHMIGHVQTNKIKDFLPWVHLVHGVDRMKVLEVLERECAKLSRNVDILLQVHIAEESTKFGWDASEIADLARPEVWEEFPHVRPVGMMGMATFTDDEQQVRREFALLAALFKTHGKAFDQLARSRGASWEALSMGMSGDWAWALEEGSSMVRIGSAIFGDRNLPL
ncbi:MAG: YggS family pyridoxal phosphate-dependent enzyme [Bacteroidetes bacterium]|nr:YggS family pyridoxal phosphate-dependent enzyme [Bacteroidota bacterium]MDA0903149.1 YggS family pyridoxal phosphate-dependent enzyme [Bacteroidota bacterium]MDA1242396.1 YggS family pyridoxal phosphate-dependent enzyme [Bacteroidota bacterium]